MFLFKSKIEQKAEKLAGNTYDNTPEFSFKGREFLAKVLDVYDGDTITITVKVDDQYYRMNCRLNGLDTPELKSHDEMEKIAGKMARKHLINMITKGNISLEITRDEIRKICADSNSILLIKCFDFDKYGRLLVEIHDSTGCLNDKMIDDGFAGRYDGGTKGEWRNYFKHL